VNKLDLKTVPKLKPNPVFKGLPDNLKDPKTFKKVEKKLINAIFSDHKHATVKAYLKCKRCQDKFKKRQAFIKDLGFTSYEQYTEWKKVMTIIDNKKDFQVK